MFKFDFDIDDADDLEHISPTSKVQPLPSDNPSLDLEPFTEILIDHLVRLNLPSVTDCHDLTLQRS